jgi:Squalene-hopene cyclase C-terminal domain
MNALRISLALILLAVGPALGDDSPEAKALAYLSTEVPRWSSEHHCYSCHNNGDAARALYAAVRLGRAVPLKATLDTDRWLARPEGWGKNGGDGPFSDKALARLQFASALASALDAGRLDDRAPLLRASAALAEDQGEDGSWKGEEQNQVGSPATYGRPLATWVARETLRVADASKHRSRIEKADTWLRRLPIESVMDASAVLLARAFDDSTEGFARRDMALDLLKRGQSREGGWGPYARSPSEVFDTALALQALDHYRDQPGLRSMIEKGRDYLVETQHDDGSWTETTRPTGAESYAQRLSTTGWATLALLMVKPQ